MKIVRDPIWKDIELTDITAKIISTPEFQRLNGIKQLGPTYLLYPGSTHTRFSHSIGVYHIASRMIDHLIKKGLDFVSPESVKAFQVAALCHDLGHFPFTHALKELPLKDHEELTGQIILNSSITKIIEDEKLDPEFTALIIDKDKASDDPEILFFRKLLSGVLDPDKLDYLNRDAFFCGVPYGIQDTDYTLSCLIPDKERGIKINSKSIVSVENLLFSKYLMYRTVYWHKDVRIATAMMKKTLFTALKENQIEDENLYSLTDSDLFEIIKQHKKNENWYCAEKVMNNELFDVIYESSMKSSNPKMLELENLDKRDNLEKQIASYFKLKENQVLIDIPEKISFESDLWINDEGRDFSHSSTVFNKALVKDFTEKLRIIRIAFDKEFTKNLEKHAIIDIKNKLADFLGDDR
ncbi:MAG: HD domain-containing protein [Treponemataceae bacterium]|nr:HD domain-containing protein [Treponemataceae bacterium]